MPMFTDIVRVFAYNLGSGSTLTDGYKILSVEKRGKGFDKVVHVLAKSDDGKAVKSRSFKHYEMVEVFGVNLYSHA